MSTVPTTVTLPSCTDGQLLGTDSMGNLQCVSAPMAMLNAPTCAAGQALTTPDGMTLKCVAVPNNTTDTNTENEITMATSAVNNLQTQVTNASTASSGGKSYYVGNTTVTSVGQITFSGQPNGIPAATAQCNAAFAGSHECSVYEMYDSFVAGKLVPGTPIARAWVYMMGWNYAMGMTPVNSNASSAGGPQEGTADNCGSQTYPTQNRRWTGMAVEFAELQTGFWGLKFHGGPANQNSDGEPGAPCNQALPIACCK